LAEVLLMVYTFVSWGVDSLRIGSLLVTQNEKLARVFKR
jgi:hypothetical protein